MQSQYLMLLAKARSTDSQQQTTRKVTTSRFITNRRSKMQKARIPITNFQYGEDKSVFGFKDGFAYL